MNSSEQPPRSSGDEFEDPLANYEPETYDDLLQQALVETRVDAVESSPFETIPATATVGEAVSHLSVMQHACVMVEQDGKLVGVVSDRDVLRRVALEFADIKDHPVTEIMTADPIFVLETDSVAAALCVMAVAGYRHVPVLALDGTISGIVSPQRLTAFLCERLECSEPSSD